MGTIINVVTVVIGSLIGLAFRSRFPERITQTALQVMGLFTLVIGVSMATQGRQLIMVLVSLAGGAVVGEWINIEDRLDKWGLRLEQRFNVTEGSPTKGFIYASLIYCVGSMAIVGSIADGVKGDHSILYTKAVMDGIVSIPFASTLGPGVMGSAITVLVYQGGLTLLAMQLKPIFSAEVINELTSVGGVMIMAIGFNILGFQKIRVGNFLPALILIVLILWIKRLIV